MRQDASLSSKERRFRLERMGEFKEHAWRFFLDEEAMTMQTEPQIHQRILDRTDEQSVEVTEQFVDASAPQVVKETVERVQQRTVEQVVDVPIPQVIFVDFDRIYDGQWERTSVELQSVLYQFPVSQILVPQLYTRLPCCTHPDHDAALQRDNVRSSPVQGLRQASPPPLLLVWSRQRDSVEVFPPRGWIPCLQRVILSGILIFLTWCHPCETHLLASTCRIRLWRDFWWCDWRTVVDSGGTRVQRESR